MLNILTFDIEEWFQVDCFFNLIPVKSWSDQQSRVVESTLKILHLLQRYGARATFFFLGAVADRHPQLVEKIVAQGHEIATHGYAHQRVYHQSPEEFEEDLRYSIQILKNISGRPILGYRAPFWSITSQTEWVWDILKRNEIRYDSSIYPISLSHGMPKARRFCHRVNGGIIEMPLSTVRLLHTNVPIAGGFFLRAFPSWFTSWGVRKINLDGYPAVVYAHPWELDPAHPKLSVDLKTNVLHYAFLRETERKLTQLLSGFRFGSIRDYLGF